MTPLIAYMEVHRLNFAWGCFVFPALLIGAILLIIQVARKHSVILAILIPLALLTVAAFAFFFLSAGQVTTYRDTANEVFPGPAPLGQASPDTFTIQQELPPPTQPPRTDLPPSPEPAPVLAENPSPLESSTPDFTGELYASVYPSERAAAASVTRRVLVSLDKVIPAGVKLDTLVVEQGAPKTRSVVADTARAVLPGVTIILDDPPADAREGETRATLKLDTPTFAEGESQITATLFGPSGGTGITERASAVDKPWVDSQEQPHRGSERMIVHSDLCTDRDAAHRQALDRAITDFGSLVESRLARTDIGPLSLSDQRWLSNAIRDDLQIQGRIADTFTQDVSRPYGHMWREWLLVTVQDHDFNQLAHQYAANFQHRRTDVKTTLFMALGLSAGIILLYLFLNAATKGYYMWPLRLLGIVAVVAGVFIVLRMA
jgi:hypothetical protein